jgi:hypothetical protein
LRALLVIFVTLAASTAQAQSDDDEICREEAPITLACAVTGTCDGEGVANPRWDLIVRVFMVCEPVGADVNARQLRMSAATAFARRVVRSEGELLREESGAVPPPRAPRVVKLQEPVAIDATAVDPDPAVRVPFTGAAIGAPHAGFAPRVERPPRA